MSSVQILRVHRHFRKFFVRGLLLLVCCLAQPARSEEVMTLDDVVESVQQWAEENLDTNVLAALPAIDDPDVQQFLRQVQSKLRGKEVVDLAALRSTAQTVLPVLQKSEDLQPYGAWLAAQMDYFDVAEQLRTNTPVPMVKTNLPPPDIKTNIPAAPRTFANPPAPKEREIWVNKVAKRPWPPNAKKYVDDLKPVFAEQNVPTQLIWLAEVESQFDRRAESPVGAAGLFQLMPQTAKRFGLSLWPFDQRFQPQRSATAAAQYLKYLHGKFKDWRLTLAAYNAGEGTVEKAMKRRGGKSFDDIAPHLPAQTQLYVPRVEAVIRDREGVKLEELANS